MITETFKIDANPALAALKALDENLLRLTASTQLIKNSFEGFSSVFERVAEAARQMKETLDLGGELMDVKTATGETAGNVLVLRQAFQNAGLGAEGVRFNINKLQQALSGMNDEGKSTTKALGELGISAGDLDGMLPTQQIAELQARFAAIIDPMERSRVAMELFGKGGGKMLSILGDSEALTIAREQVGGLAGEMDKNAARFDAISDAINAAGLKIQQFYAGLAGAITPALEQAAAALNHLDLTQVGVSLGSAATQVASLVHALAPMAPLFMGFAVAASGADLAVINFVRHASGSAFAGVAAAIRSMDTAIATFTGELARTGSITKATTAGLMTMGSVGSIAMAGLAAAVRAVGIALKNTLRAVAIGFVIEGISAGIDAITSKISKMNEAANVKRQTLQIVTTAADDTGKITSSGDQEAYLARKRQQLEAAQMKADDADNTKEVTAAYEEQAGAIQKIISAVETMPAAFGAAGSAGVAAAQEIGKASEDAAKKITDAQQKLTAARDADKSPDEQRSRILHEFDVKDSSGLDTAIARNQKSINGGNDDAGLSAVTTRMIEARIKLLSIEKQISEEKKRQTDEAAKATDSAFDDVKKASDWTDSRKGEIAISNAQATGDPAAEEAVRLEQRRVELIKEGIEIGKMGYRDAIKAANEVVTAEKAANDAKRAREKSDADKKAAEEKSKNDKAAADWQQGFGLDMAKEAAKLTGDPNKVRAVELEQNRRQYVQQAMEQGGMSEADANKLADQRVALEARTGLEGGGTAAQRNPRADALFADSLARVGGGGRSVGGAGENPLLKESERQTGHLKSLLLEMRNVSQALKKNGGKTVATAG